MGMNYFLSSPKCDHCGRADEKLHIGKSSHGWQFHFAAHDEPEIKSYNQLISYIKESGRKIVDEADDEMTLDDFCAKVDAKRDGLNYMNIVSNTPWTLSETDYLESTRYRITPGIDYIENRAYCDDTGKQLSWNDGAGHSFTNQWFR